MLETLIKAIIEVWQTKRTPRRKFAKSVMRLFNSMNDCQQAYLFYLGLSDTHSDYPRAHDKWIESIAQMIIALWEMRSVLNLFDPPTFDSIDDFALLEIMWAKSDEFASLYFSLFGRRRGQLHMLTSAMAHDIFHLFEWHPNPKEDAALVAEKFDLAFCSLRQFIQKNFTPEEIHDVS